MDQRLITLEQEQPANVIDFPLDSQALSRRGNLVPGMGAQDVLDTEEMIRRRFDSAEDQTNLVSKEINRSERQFKGLFAANSKFQEQKEWEDPDEDDVRIFMRKTMEHIQIVYSHLDGLTGQLNPLLVLKPSVSGLIHPQVEYERAKVKELVVNFFLEKTRFKKDILPRWRWNFLKHPSAFLRVLYKADPVEPDIEIEVVDRGMLYFDPNNTKGDIKKAGWVIERFVVTRDKVEQNIRDGHWYIPDGVSDISNLFAPPQDDTVARIVGNDIMNADHRGHERDDLIEGLHYWQAEQDGSPHAYGVILGGKDGRLVRWGPNPYAYKGVPYRGKSYLRDPYHVDGISLSMQYRSIQETYNTLFNLRIEDVLENVKRRIHVFEGMFNETTKEDHENNQKYIRFSNDFFQQVMDSGKKATDFMIPPSDGDSTQHLLQDLQYLGAEGRTETSINDAFRGQNPQSGATLGQVQENLIRALGVFRPVFAQEMSLVEEVGEIINVYFEDEDFFGPERIVSIVGPNRYKDTVRGFFDVPGTGLSARRVTPDEMAVDVTVEVMNQAEHLASRTLRMSQRNGFFENLRQHPELAKEAKKTINFTALFLRDLADIGEDIEAITYTPEQQQKRAQEEKQEQEQTMAQQAQFTGMMKQAEENARMQREVQVAQAKTGLETDRDETRIGAELEARLIEIVSKANADNRAALEKQLENHFQMIERMWLEAALEIEAAKHGANVSVQTGGNSISKQ